MKMSILTLKMDDKWMRFYETLVHEYNFEIHNFASKLGTLVISGLGISSKSGTELFSLNKMFQQ